MTNILIVEDDQRLAKLISQYLERNQFVVDCYFTGAGAVEYILSDPPDLLILDLMLPGSSGFEICRTLREHLSIPIIILTANDSETDEIVGLEIGADDYISKLIDPRLLLARIKALLRRHQTSTIDVQYSSSDLQFGPLRLSQSTQTAHLHEHALTLTTAEFDLLWLLATNAGQILSRDDILGELRGLEFDGFDRSIDARISRIRRKLQDDPEQPEWIKTVRGKGYLFLRPSV